jgi:hypothetical protein
MIQVNQRTWTRDIIENSLDLKSESVFRDRVTKRLDFWKPIVNGVLSYSEASRMHPQELKEICAALNMKGTGL